MNDFMKLALDEAEKGMSSGEGGPFGAVIVKDGKVVAKGHNSVLKDNDPTAHAEVVAIREAAKALGTWDLSGCDFYSTCKPCPMCFGAICWARIKTVYYGCTEQDAAEIGFEDKHIYEAICDSSQDLVSMSEIDRDDCLKVFREWAEKKDKSMY